MKIKIEQCSWFALFVFAIGCGGERENNAAPAVETPSAAAPTPSSPAPVAAARAGGEAKPPTADELPLPEDFEAQVEATISATTYKADFADLDREITKDCAQ